MVRQLTSNVPALPAGMRIARVEDRAALEAHAIALYSGFGAPDPHVGLDVFPVSLLDDERVTFFSGYLDAGQAPTATAGSVVAVSPASMG